MTRCPHCDSIKFSVEAEPIIDGTSITPIAWKNICLNCDQPSIFVEETGTQITVEQWQQSQ